MVSRLVVVSAVIGLVVIAVTPPHSAGKVPGLVLLGYALVRGGLVAVGYVLRHRPPGQRGRRPTGRRP